MSKKNKSVKAIEKFFEEIDKEFEDLFDFFKGSKKEKNTREKHQGNTRPYRVEYKSNQNGEPKSNSKKY